MAPNLLSFDKNGAQRALICKMVPKIIQKSQKWPKNFSGHFGEILAKMFLLPKICLFLHLSMTTSTNRVQLKAKYCLCFMKYNRRYLRFKFVVPL